jgi:outer membrane protein assembly factor BamB
MLEKREFDTNDFLFRFWTAIAFVAGMFSFVVFVLLMVNYLQIRAADPVNHELLTQLRQQYAAEPEQNQVLAERIQQLDLLTRKAFFTSQTHLRVGGLMLLAGIVTFLVAFKNLVRWQRVKPELEETPTADKEFLAFGQSRQLITWACVGALGLGLLSTLLTERTLNQDIIEALAKEDHGEEAEIQLAELWVPAWEELEKNWPSFRGPASNGNAHFTTAPLEWNLEEGTNVKWKVEIPLPGANSPIVWENKVFISAADESNFEVHCYDTETGEQLWVHTLKDVPGSPAEPPQVTQETGHAAPTMVAHGGAVYAVFANGDMGAIDFDGNLRWSKNIGVPDNHYGHSSSLLAWENLVFVQLDHMIEAKVMALDMMTGDEVWNQKRETISWASPVIARTEMGPQLLLNSESTVDAYNPTTGALLWSEEFLAGEVAPSPVYANGKVFAANEYALAAAVQLSGTADAIESEIVWEYDYYLPEVASPISDGEYVYYGTASGDFVCLNFETGEEVYAEELGVTFYSSPVMVGDRMYIADVDGVMFVVKTGAEFELLAKIENGEEIFATPAFMDGRIYLRTAEHLYCIEQTDA